MPEEDVRIARARAAGLNVEGINLDPDAGQKQLQDRADAISELGYIPSDGTDLGLSDEENLAILEDHIAAKDAKAAEHAAPPVGDTAGGPPGSYSETSEEEDAGEGPPAKSASRDEWDEYARSQGVDPDEYSTKDSLIEALES